MAYAMPAQSSASFNIALNESQSSSSLDDLRRQARVVEGDLDLKLVQLSKLGAAYNHSHPSRFSAQSSSNRSVCDPEQRYDTITSEINELLATLARLNDAMQPCAERQGSSGASSRANILHALQRHRDILNDYHGEYEKTKANIAMMRDRSELQFSKSKESAGADRALPYFSTEQEHLRGSDRLLDAHISVAMGTREHLGAQRARLVTTQHRLGSVASRLPLIGSLLNRINFRRRKDCLLVSSVVSLCTFALVIYVLG